MNNDITNQSLIEATVNSAIKRIQNDPERSMRNIIDMALLFCSNGRFQQHFLELAQQMLEHEDSAYYRIIPDTISNVDSKRITSFGINLGYHSCTKGARTIRKIEKEFHFNIPWCITLDIKNEIYEEKKQAYFSLIEQGQALGVYTWFINPHSEISLVLEFAETFSNSAFIIVCQPNDISEAILDEFNEIYNVFFVVNYATGIEDACALLRKRRFLFSVVYKYYEKDVKNIFNHALLYDLCSLHTTFSLFYADASCPLALQKQVHQHIQKTRYEQQFPTIPFDLIYDIRFIDEIVSEDAVSIYFDSNGRCHTYFNDTCFPYNIFNEPLIDILKHVVPKG